MSEIGARLLVSFMAGLLTLVALSGGIAAVQYALLDGKDEGYGFRAAIFCFGLIALGVGASSGLIIFGLWVEG
jgi:hypothetical protein